MLNKIVFFFGFLIFFYINPTNQNRDLKMPRNLKQSFLYKQYGKYIINLYTTNSIQSFKTISFWVVQW